MRILRVITRLNIGGPARQVSFLHKEYLRQYPNDVFLLFGKIDDDEGDFEPSLEQRNNAIQLNSLKRPILPLEDSLALFRLILFLLKEPIDVLHTHTAKAGMLARSAALIVNGICVFRKKIKVVHTFHGHVFSGYFSGKKIRLIKIVERFLANRTDVLITLTPKLVREISHHLCISEDRFTVVPLGLKLNPYLNVERSPFFDEAFGVKAVKWVGWVGRLVDIKNPMRFIKIASEILKRTRDQEIHFVLVGDGHLRSDLEEELFANKLGDRIHLFGWTSDLIKVYSGIDVFFNTSDNEGTPVAVLESLSSGVPVVATDVGGSAEVLAGVKNKILLKPKDVYEGDELNQMTEMVLKSSRLESSARERIVEDYSQMNLKKSLDQIYQDISRN